MCPSYNIIDVLVLNLIDNMKIYFVSMVFFYLTLIFNTFPFQFNVYVNRIVYKQI